MKKKIRCIYIDGTPLSGKTSVTREIKAYLEEIDKPPHEIYNFNMFSLEGQRKALENDENIVVLKENTVLGAMADKLRQKRTVPSLAQEYEHRLNMEKDINARFGAVHFLLQPTAERNMEIYPEGIPEDIQILDVFYNCINQYSMTHGLDIKIIRYDEFDMIYDVRDKILKILTSDYDF